MKKHRNFLIFYSIWLVAIMGIFVVFGEESQDGHLKVDSEICTLSDDYLPDSATKSYENKRCTLRNL